MANDADDEGQETEGESAVSNRLFPLFVAGFILVLMGILIVIAASVLGGSNSSSASMVIFIGPFPIVFGAGPDAGLLILIGVILAAVSIVVFVVMSRKDR